MRSGEPREHGVRLQGAMLDEPEGAIHDPPSHTGLIVPEQRRAVVKVRPRNASYFRSSTPVSVRPFD
jgi:hypothetical protein